MAGKPDDSRRGWRYPRVSPDALPGLAPRLFGELDRHIRPQHLQSDQLPEDFYLTEDGSGLGIIVFEGERYDLNITVFKPPEQPICRCTGSGMFVISNGAGVAASTVDQVARFGAVAGMIDLKRNFVARKVLAALRMAVTARPDVDVVLLNIISGIALAADAVTAVSTFCEQTAGRVRVVFRFNGPDAGDDRSLLRDVTARHPSVRLVDSTAELVQAAAELCANEVPRVAGDAEIERWVEGALATRARLGVTVDPAGWLRPERTIEALFGRKRNTKLGILGFGKTARFQVRAMEALGVDVAWAVTPTAGKHPTSSRAPDEPRVEVFATAAEAIAARGKASIVVNYAPAAHVLEATLDLVAAASPRRTMPRLVMIVAESMAYDHVIGVIEALEAARITQLGPNCPGLMVVEDDGGRPDRFKIGNMPAHLFDRPGGLSLAGRSGTVLFDMVDQAADAGIGTRMAWAIGGDRYTGLGFLDALLLFEGDPATEVIVLNCEAGGLQEQLAAELIATGVISKPVIALVAGQTLPAGVQYGHPGSTKFTEADDPRVKEHHLRDAGCVIVQNPTEMVRVIEAIERSGWPIAERRRDALWRHVVDADARLGRRWLEGHRSAFDLLHRIVGDWRLVRAGQTTPGLVHELVDEIARVGAEAFAGLFGSRCPEASDAGAVLDAEAFAAGFEKSPEYVAGVARGVGEVGVARFRRFVVEMLTPEAFNAALRVTPWASADILDEAQQIGLEQAIEVISRTVGLQPFRQTFAAKPWNTAHAFRSINNMRRWRFVRAFHRLRTRLVDEGEVILAAWQRNPWTAVKLVRGYDRIPDQGLERALEDGDTRARLVELATRDPQGLLEVGKRAYRASQQRERPFHEVYRELLARGSPARPSIETELERMDADDVGLLVDTVFTRDGFEASRRAHPGSTARALRLVNDEGNASESGALKLARIYRANADTLDSPAFRLAVRRNLWMTVDLLRAMSRLDPVEVRRIVDYVVTKPDFDFSIAEHQWGTSQALHKIADMGASLFFKVHELIEDATTDRACFRDAFKKNPRDTIQIAQAVAQLGHASFRALLLDPDTRVAFVARMRKSPRATAHLLREIDEVGVFALNALIDAHVGREVFNRLLVERGPDLVRIVARIAIVGADDFGEELRAWRGDEEGRWLTTENALEVSETLKESALSRRFDQPRRRLTVSLPGEERLRVSEAELQSLYESYPDWAEVLLKVQEGKPMPVSERADVYHLVSGRHRYRALMLPVLANFIPFGELRRRIARGERLIPEISRLKGVAQSKGHRFDAYSHTLDVLEQLHHTVLPLAFLDEPGRERVHQLLAERVDHVTRRDLLVLAAALHDLGKADGLGGHVARGVALARRITERIGLTDAQRELVEAVIHYHQPKKLRRAGEPWDAFRERGGLDKLYGEITGHGANPYPVETILHYHADILGRRGDKTSAEQVARREAVTRDLIGRFLRASEPPDRRSSA